MTEELTSEQRAEKANLRETKSRATRCNFCKSYDALQPVRDAWCWRLGMNVPRTSICDYFRFDDGL